MMERELKLTALDEQTLDAILTHTMIQSICVSDPLANAQAFTAIYYDSEDFALAQARCGLRARQEGDRLRAAIKLPGRIVDGLSERVEYEADLHSWPSKFRDFPEGDLLTSLTEHVDLDAFMVERVQVSMARRIRMLAIETTKIELVADHGIISGLRGNQRLHEIELELIEGEVEPLIALGEMIKTEFGLRYSDQTKLGIGLSLC